MSAIPIQGITSFEAIQGRVADRNKDPISLRDVFRIEQNERMVDLK